MKKIEVKEYAPCEQLVIVYELEEKYKDMDESEIDFNDICVWDKIDLYDPMLKYNSGVNIGYKGGGPFTMSQIIVETFRDYHKSSREYIKARNNIEEYLSKIPNDNNQAIENFTILEKDVKHLL